LGIDGLAFECACALDQCGDVLGLLLGLLAAEVIDLGLSLEVECHAEGLSNGDHVGEGGLGVVAAEDSLDGGFGDAAAGGEGGVGHPEVFAAGDQAFDGDGEGGGHGENSIVYDTYLVLNRFIYDTILVLSYKYQVLLNRGCCSQTRSDPRRFTTCP
jgi:hypothetical protein